MDKSKENVLDNFVDVQDEDQKDEDIGAKKTVLDEREGLIERVDRILVTNDGRQLLREQY